LRESGNEALHEGILLCSNPQCLSEYPVVDGIPLLLSDLRTYVAQSIHPLLSRTDLSSTMESLLGDCCGPGSAFDLQRQYLSTYVFNHYVDFDTDASDFEAVLPGTVANVLRKGLTLLDREPAGLVLDLGCSVGRTTFELARRGNDLVLGLDLNFSMLRTAATIVNSRTVTYDRRKGGIVFERRSFPVEFPRTELVDFWACDVTNLPFADAGMALCTSMNLIDCVSSPYDHLRELTRVLQPGGAALLASPYDWSAQATALESWLGGHSQRTSNQGNSAAILRSLFAGGEHPHALTGLTLAAEAENVPWTLRLHDRSFITYLSHLAAGRKT